MANILVGAEAAAYLKANPVAKIKRTRRICPTCKLLGLEIVTRPSTLYACGYESFAQTCSTCNGTGFVDPSCVAPVDNKTAAANDDEPETNDREEEDNRGRDRDEWRHEAAAQQRLK